MQDPDQVVDGQIRVLAFQGVEGGWGRPFVGVEQDQPPKGGFGEPVQEVGDQVAFGVDDHHSPASLNVLEGEVGDEGGLAGPGGAEQVEVLAGVGRGEPDGPGGAELAAAQALAPGGQGGGCGGGSGAGPGEPGDGRVGGQVGQAGQLAGREQVTSAQGPARQGVDGVVEAVAAQTVPAAVDRE